MHTVYIAARNEDGSIMLSEPIQLDNPADSIAKNQESFAEQTGLKGPFFGLIEGDLN